MAVLRQDLVRSTFQERQITLLTSLEKTVNSIEEDLPEYGKQYTDRMIDSMDHMFLSLSKSIESIFRTGTSTYTTKTERAIIKAGKQVADDVSDAIEDDEQRRQEEADAYKDYLNESTNKLIDTVKSVARSIGSILGTFGISLDRYLSEADRYLELQNTYVRNANTTWDATISLRDSILAEVRDLNKITGGVYNELESYETIVGLVNATSIKNAAFYEEYARLFIETQKTMNLDLGVLAQFSDKFYRKYTFSSLTMEKLTDSIRENTAGTSVSENALMSFMETIDTDIMAMAMRMGGDVEANYAKLQDTVTSAYSWLHTSGYDPEYLFNLISGALSGNQESQVTLGKLGINATDGRLLEKLLTDPASLFSEIITSIGDLNIATGYGNYGKVMASAYGIDYDTAVTAQYRGLTTDSYYSFLNNRPVSEDPSMELFVSAEERTANLTGHMSVTLADLSKSIGIKSSTIIDILGDIKDIVTSLWGAFGANFLGSALGTFLSNKFISSIIGTGSSGMSGLLTSGGSSLFSKLGPALGVGAAAVGIAAVVQSIYDNIKYKEEIKERTADDFEFGSGIDLSQPVYMSATGQLDDAGHMTYGYTNNGVGGTPYDSYGTYYDTPYMDEMEDRISAKWGYNSEDPIPLNGLKLLLGTGWWSEGGPWYTYLPLVGGITGSSNASNAKAQAQQSQIDAKYAYSAVERFLAKPYVSVFKLLYAILSESGDDPTVFGPALVTYYADIAEGYLSRGFVPTKLTEKGVQAWKPYTESQYASYIETFMNDKKQGNKTIPYLRMGTNYVNSDQLALLHEGEAVIPAQYNPFTKYSRAGSSDYLHSISRNTLSYSRVADTYLPYLQDIAETLRQMKDFLKFWRLDDINREAVKSVTDAAKSTNLRLSLVTGSTGLGMDSI